MDKFLFFLSGCYQDYKRLLNLLSILYLLNHLSSSLVYIDALDDSDRANCCSF